MRSLAVIVLVATVGTADARMLKAQARSPGQQCPRAPTWDDVTKCLRPKGTLTIERVLPRVRLVRVVEADGERSDDHRFFLYAQRDDRTWELAGSIPAQFVTVLGMAPYTISGHAGYRILLGQLSRGTASLDGATELSVIVATQESVFCSGNDDDCAAVTTHCDVLFRGKALWTFRGTLAFEKGFIVDEGDRSRGGRTCNPSEIVSLGWPTS